MRFALADYTLGADYIVVKYGTCCWVFCLHPNEQPRKWCGNTTSSLLGANYSALVVKAWVASIVPLLHTAKKSKRCRFASDSCTLL